MAEKYTILLKKKYTPTIWPRKKIAKTVKLQNVNYVILGANLSGSKYLPVSHNEVAKVDYDVTITSERTQREDIYIHLYTTLKTIPSIQ